MSLPAYGKYRESGVERLGRVPDHWSVSPAKYAISTFSGGTAIKGECSDTPEDGLYQGYSASGPDVWLPGYDHDGPGMVLSAVGARCGKVFKADGKWGVVANTHCLLPRGNADRDFLCYLVNDEIWWEKGGTAQPFVKVWETLQRKVGLPDRAEQALIARFLDCETAKIDALVGEQRRLIELLTEKRQAVISHAVTKGLDPTVPMKNTGIEWLGDVPAHWEVVPTGYRYEVQLGRMLNAERSEGPDMRPYLRVFDVQWGAINTDDLPLMDFPFDARERYRLQPGDLIVNEGGSYVGRSAIWRGDLTECYYQKALHRLRARNSANDTAEFFLFIMEFATTLGVFVAGGNQTTIDHLTAEQLREYRFAFPPLPEQVAISSFIVAETVKLEALMDEAETAIALFQERRAALISAAVTGKIDVRGLAPSVKEDAYAA